MWPQRSADGREQGPGAGGVWVSVPGLWVGGSLWPVVSVSFGEELELNTWSTGRGQPEGEVMSVRNVIKGRCLGENLNSKSDTVITLHIGLCSWEPVAISIANPLEGFV